MARDRIIREVRDIVGAGGVIDDPAAMAPYLTEQRDLYRSKAALVVRPATTEELAAVVRVCAAARVPMVPQGGNTGLCGGAAPDETGHEVILSLGRMNKVRAIDPVDFSITVEAGCILADVQRTAAKHDCLFPLSLAAEGSCQIGGNLATNAGGVNVLRYGNARELVLGLEVVLADGRVWNGLRALRKDNTGYALRQVFIGAEGTLGIITAAVLRLFPKPLETATAFCALARLEDATRLLSHLRTASGDEVSACELIPRIGLEMCLAHIPGVSDPLSQPHPWYVLIELSTSRPSADLKAHLSSALEASAGEGLISDAVVAASIAQRDALWRIRESLPEAQKHEGGSIKHDVSVPVSRVPTLITEGMALLAREFPDARPVPFGHLGDGNIHFNLSQPAGADKAAFLARWSDANRHIHDLVVRLNGSISAEHGIGRLKTAELAHYKDPLELDLMRRLKHALDPHNLMNPGKVLKTL